MAYLVLAVVVLLVIGTITTAVMARQHWRWFHVTATITIAFLGAIFPFYIAGALRSRAAWNEQYDTLVKRVAVAAREQQILKLGDQTVGGVGLVDLSQDLNRASLDAGRRWRSLRPTGRAGQQITLQRAPDPNAVADGQAGGDDPADAADAIPKPPLAPVGTVMYGFAERTDPETQQAVPAAYLGEYRVVRSSPNTVVIEPVAALNPAQIKGLSNAQQWTLYELLPLDSHEVFLAEGSSPTDDNILGRIDDELVRRTLGNRVTPATLKEYLEDGRRSQPDDPPSSRWMLVEFVNPFQIDVDDVKLNAPISSGGFFDGIGRALDVRLKRSGGDGTVSFEKGDQILLKQEAADPLIDDGTAKLIDRFYLRPLNDYRFILRRIQLEVNELRSRVEELQFEATVLKKSIDRTNGLIVIQQDRKNKLEQDLAQFTLEREAAQKAVSESEAFVAETRQTIKRLHSENVALEAQLDGFNAVIISNLTATGGR